MAEKAATGSTNNNTSNRVVPGPNEPNASTQSSLPHASSITQSREGLPEHWVAQWDAKYNQWFYVDESSPTKASTWDHPKGANAKPPTVPSTHLPPPYVQAPSQYPTQQPQGAVRARQYPAYQPYGQPGYGQPYGYPYGQPYGQPYGNSQPQVVQQQSSSEGRFGGGSALPLVGGLAGGALLGSALMMPAMMAGDSMAYNSGYENGYDQGMDNSNDGGMYGGGMDGGGGF